MTTVTIHCADTPNGKEFHNTDIDEWHKDRGFFRTAPIANTFNPSLKHIGYHFVICVDGSIETGRAVGEAGAHVQGHNTDNIGICLIGKDHFTQVQWDSLNTLLYQLTGMLGGYKLMGHYQFDTAIAQGKTCPNFDVEAYSFNHITPSEHLLEV